MQADKYIVSYFSERCWTTSILAIPKLKYPLQALLSVSGQSFALEPCLDEAPTIHREKRKTKRQRRNPMVKMSNLLNRLVNLEGRGMSQRTVQTTVQPIVQPTVQSTVQSTSRPTYRLVNLPLNQSAIPLSNPLSNLTSEFQLKRYLWNQHREIPRKFSQFRRSHCVVKPAPN
jgi:hypothetical protein